MSKKPVKILSWKPIATWKWDIPNQNQDNTDGDEEECGICHNPYEMAAPGVKWPGDDSGIVLGHCGHCPICRQPFEFGT